MGAFPSAILESNDSDMCSLDAVDKGMLSAQDTLGRLAASLSDTEQSIRAEHAEAKSLADAQVVADRNAAAAQQQLQVSLFVSYHLNICRVSSLLHLRELLGAT